MITTHLQAGKLALHSDWAELDGIVEQALEAAATRRRGHRLEVFVEPLRCELDAQRLGQVIRNLVENAYKYTPERTRVGISARKTPRGRTIQIADAGPGIPVDQREALFEAFSRIDETNTGQDGVGLGLFVVSQIVSAMDGHIDLASSARGTSFEISIPCKREIMPEPRLGLVAEGERRRKS
jgi:two-component system, OmpR family, sensor kinase